MKAPSSTPFLHGTSTTLTSEVGQYFDWKIPDHAEQKLDPLISGIIDRIKKLHSDSVLLILIAGFPGIGKTAQLGHFISAIVAELGGSRGPIVAYKHPETGILLPSGHVCQKGSVIEGSSDWAFKGVGPIRRKDMLERLENFLELWADNPVFARILSAQLQRTPISDHIYMGSALEKKQGVSLGEAKYVNFIDKRGKKVVIAEGVNLISASEEIVQQISQFFNVEVLKVLMNVSGGSAMERVLRREKDKKGIPFPDSMNHRLVETQRIYNTFIRDALLDPDVLLLDRPRGMPPYTEAEKTVIADYLRDYRIPPQYRDDEELVSLIYRFTGKRQDYFRNLKGVSEDVFNLWKIEKYKKKGTILQTSS